MVTEAKGDLIELALEGHFDIIAHGCNCQSVQKAGIAKKMVEAFSTDRYKLELEGPNINKLGLIDIYSQFVETGRTLYVANMYTQVYPGKGYPIGTAIPFDYPAFRLCLMKLNVYANKHRLRIGLPWIGCGLAKADKRVVREYIETYLTDCEVTIVDYDR